VLRNFHYWDTQEAPAGFELLASRDESRIHLARQAGKLVYGCLFHLEMQAEKHSDSRRLPGDYLMLGGSPHEVLRSSKRRTELRRSPAQCGCDQARDLDRQMWKHGEG
jgi:GMP synthase-like glutamine amidotransferase